LICSRKLMGELLRRIEALVAPRRAGLRRSDIDESIRRRNLPAIS
jgi:hypothetical protein